MVDEGKVTGCGSVVAVATKILRDSCSTFCPDQNTRVLVFLLGVKTVKNKKIKSKCYFAGVDLDV